MGITHKHMKLISFKQYPEQIGSYLITFAKEGRARFIHMGKLHELAKTLDLSIEEFEVSGEKVSLRFDRSLTNIEKLRFKLGLKYLIEGSHVTLRGQHIEGQLDPEFSDRSYFLIAANDESRTLFPEKEEVAHLAQELGFGSVEVWHISRTCVILSKKKGSTSDRKSQYGFKKLMKRMNLLGATMNPAWTK